MGDRKITQEIKDLKPDNENISSNRKESNDLLLFFIGLVLLAVGLFLLSQKINVHTSWGRMSFWGINFSSGLVIIPLIIGIIWQFVNPKSIVAKVFMVLGGVIILASIIMSVSITLTSMNLFDYILVIGMSAAGAGLLLRVLFRKRK